MKRSDQNAIDGLKAGMTPASVLRAEQKAREILFNLPLAELRKEAGLLQSDVEGFSQSSLSKIESRSDMKISTLRDYLHSIGMELEIRASKQESGKRRKTFLLLKD